MSALSAWLLGLGVLGVAIAQGHAGEPQVSELIAHPSNFDGRPVALRGTFGRLHVHATRRGSRYYTFQLTQDGRSVLVIVQDRPLCNVGAVARVQGRFDGSRKRVDAITVTCD